MLKLNKKNIVALSLIVLCIIASAPFVNGLGCNASFIVLNARLGTLYGKCEYGRVTMSVKHILIQEKYNATGVVGYWNGRYFVLITHREIPKNKNGDVISDIDLRPFYYRNFYTGNIMGNEHKYLIYASPEPTISQIFLHGHFGLFP